MKKPFTRILKFHLFISYTRTPDGPLANEIERFLESFHQSSAAPAAGEKLDPLQVCIDGSDFRMPPPDQGLADECPAAQCFKRCLRAPG